MNHRLKKALGVTKEEFGIKAIVVGIGGLVLMMRDGKGHPVRDTLLVYVGAGIVMFFWNLIIESPHELKREEERRARESGLLKAIINGRAFLAEPPHRDEPSDA